MWGSLLRSAGPGRSEGLSVEQWLVSEAPSAAVLPFGSLPNQSTFAAICEMLSFDILLLAQKFPGTGAIKHAIKNSPL